MGGVMGGGMGEGGVFVGGDAVGLFVEGGSVGLAFGAVVLEHLQDFIDGIVGVVEDRHRLYCYFLLYPTHLHPPLLRPPYLPSFHALLLQMGGCISHGRPLAQRHRMSLSAAVSANLSQQEIGMLQLIFEDLSLRAVSREISLENFILFFHKNGLWGERLFQEFDTAEDKQISEEEFISGIARIGKGSEREKIRLLFRFFSQQHDGANEGIFFSEFVKMLYNYPKEDLKEVLNDRDFIEYELSRRGRKAQGHSQAPGRLRRAETSAMGSSVLMRVTRKASQDDRGSESHRDDEREMTSIVAEQIMHNAKEYQPHETMIKLRAGDASYDIKTINIQQVVRKFALKIFRDAGANPAIGKLNFDQFYQWISVHRVLFQNYFDGFHAEIWELDPDAHVPRFLTSTPEKDSQARLQTESGTMDVRLRLFHGVLVAWREGEREAVAVVCLQGLAVQRVFDTSCGFGLSFTHRDRIYPERRAYFRNENLAGEWADLLRFYRGESIHEKYTIGGKIGTGKFSVVYKCKHNFELREYAVKEIATFKLDPQALELIAHESSIMQVIQHPLLLAFKECLQTRKHIYIVTQYVPGVNLFEEVREYQTLQDYDAAKITQMIIVGIAYLHSLEIVHRDLKPENIMIMERSDTREIDLIKIIDFGFSDHLSHLKSRHNVEMVCGTPNYIAPEVLREEGTGFKSDNFAIGVIIYYMLTGNLPFNDYSIPEILKNTLEGQFSYPALPISAHAKDLIERFLLLDTEQRISLEDALRHPWFEQLKQPRKTPRKQKPKSSLFGIFQ